MKTVAVLLINYNGIDDTIECVNSLLESKTTANLEIVIVDNGSNNQEADRLEKLYPKFHIIKSEKNLGFAGGNNLGINYLMRQNIDYLLMLNNDTVVAKDMIEILINADNGHCVCLPKMYYYDSPKKIWYGGGNINRITGATKHMQYNCIDKNQEDETNLSCTFATGACVLISKNVMKDIGQLDDDYFMYCEDADFSLRLLERSMDILYVPQAHLWHKVGKSSGGEGSLLSEYYMARNSLLFLNKHKNFFVITAFPYILVRKYIRMVKFVLTGKKQWKAIYKGIHDYFKGVRGKADKCA